MTAPPERLASALADRYRIESELGAGGMATVYLAHFNVEVGYHACQQRRRPLVALWEGGSKYRVNSPKFAFSAI